MMYDRLLLERSKYLEYRGELVGAEVQCCQLRNTSCGDELTMYVQRVDGVITKMRWEGQGCAIALVAADICCEVAEGLRIEQLKKLQQEAEKIIMGLRQTQMESSTKRMREMEKWQTIKILECVARMPARVKCAKLAWGVVDYLQ